MQLFLRVLAACLAGVGASRLAVHNGLGFRDKMGLEGFQAWEDDASRLARIEELKTQIFDLVGLEKVKESMRTLLDLVEFGKMREKQGMHGFAAQSLHMRFLGNPGTGKTVVARLVGELLLAMGAITPVEGGNTSGSFVFKEASRADLVGEHTGATAIKVQKVVKEALGGVLFIDEAYALVQGPRDNFGVEAVDTLIKEMEDNRAHLIVILAGYTKEMDDFFNSNPGFQSRVPFSFTFNDYTCPELTKIGELQLKSKSMMLSANNHEGEWWLRKGAQLMTQCCDEEDATKCDMSGGDRSNGNGRTIRNLLESSFRHMALRVLKSTTPEKLKAFDEVVKEAPPMDCHANSQVSVGSYNGPDVRCQFSELEGSDILATTADMINLNAAPCKLSFTKEQVRSVAKSAETQTWAAVAAALAEVTETKTGSKSKLQAACSTLTALFESTSGSFLELEDSVDDEAELEDTSEGKNPLRGYNAAPSPGWCQDGRGKMHPDFQKRIPLEECAELCDKTARCTGFAAQTGVCKIYKGSVPRTSTGSPRRVTCYQRTSAATEAGVPRLAPSVKGSAATIQPTASRTSHGRSSRPTVSRPTVSRTGSSGYGSSGSRSGSRPSATKRPSKKPSWQSKAGRGYGQGYDTRKHAQEVIEENEVPGGTNEKVDKLMEKLNRLVGLTKVKAGMAELRAMVEFDQWRKRLLPDAKSLMGQSFHMQFLGNPGTGKTVVARMVGKLLVEMGVIKKAESKSEKDDDIFVEVSRADLVAEYKGQTAPKVLGAVSKAMGGVLFVDEAYSLKKEGKDSFGQEAVDTLIKEIEDKRDQVIAIFAGYEKEMETFFEANPGFKSRVPFKFYFDDYNCEELSHIGSIFMADKGFRTSEGASTWLNRTIRFSTGCCEGDPSECEDTLRDSGNGRTVRNILEASYRNFAARIVPRLYHSKGVRPVLDRIETYATAREENYDAYKLKYGTGKILRKKLEKDFGMAAVCSKEVSGHGETWQNLCDKARGSLKILQGEDIALVAASRISERLLSSCRNDKKDMKQLDELAASALQAVSEESWGLVAKAAGDFDCIGTFEALESVPNPPPAPVYDNLQLMEDSEELKPLLQKLRSLVGLKSVKEAMGQLFGLVKLSLWRERLGMQGLGGQSFHMRFLGNPGTGKTVVARIVGEMMVKMGVVEMPAEVKKRLKEEAKIESIRQDREVDIPLIFREAARVDMVAQYLGQTAPKVEKAVSEAIGGVLFIDEAYALVRDGKDSFGQEAVDTLIKEMEDKRKNVIVILAGYETEMDTFFDSNPGFKSRVPFTFRFEDYSCSELGQIGSLVLSSQGLAVASEASPRLEDLIAFASGCCNDVAEADCHPSRDNGNGRTVRNVIEALQRAMARRVVQSRSTDVESLKTLTLADLTQVAEEQAAHRLEGPCGQTGLVTTLAQAAEQKAGLAMWNRNYQLSKPSEQLYRMVRESQRLSKSLSSFQSTSLGKLQKDCSVGLSNLVKKLDRKIKVTCEEQLPKMTRELDNTAKLTVKQFEQMVRPLQMTSAEAVYLLELFNSEDLPNPLDKLQDAAMNCEERLDDLRGQSVLAPMEMAVQALTAY